MSFSHETELFGWGYTPPMVGYSSQWMQPQMSMPGMGPRLVQLASQNVPNQLAAAFPPSKSDSRAAYIDNLGSAAKSLKDQEAALEAKKRALAQEQADVQHMYDAAVKAREENKVRRAQEEEDARAAAIKQDVQAHGLPWQQEMGTDISFIPTAQFPASMKGAWHHNAPYEGGEGAQALHRDAPPALAKSKDAAAPEKEAALQLAVKEKVDLDAAKPEIKMLKDKLAGKLGASAKNSAQQQLKQQVKEKLDKVKKAAKASRPFSHSHGQQLRMMQMQQPQPRLMHMQPQPWRRAVRVLPVRMMQAERVAPKAAPKKPAAAKASNAQFQAALNRFITAGKEAGLVKRSDRMIKKLMEAPSGPHGLQGKVVKGHQKSLFDYNLDSKAEPGEHVWPYKKGATMGGPCSVPGACSHHGEEEPGFTLQDDEFHAKRIEDRFKEPEEEEEPDEVVRLGDSQVGGSLDDYVPPEDAYVHNLLTSSAPGIDHFGHLAPLSKANIDIMYGPSAHTLVHNVYGHKLHSDGRGGLASTAAEDAEAEEEEDAEGEYYHDHAPAVLAALPCVCVCVCVCARVRACGMDGRLPDVGE